MLGHVRRLAAMGAWVAVALACGCGPGYHSIIPAPVAVRADPDAAFERTALQHRDTAVRVLYATDREPRRDNGRRARYGPERGGSVRLGVVDMRLGGPGWDWDRLIEATGEGRRVGVRVTSVREVGRLWDTVPVDDPDYAPEDADARAGEAEFAALVREELDGTRGRDIVVYVPGFNNTFDSMARRMAGFAHFMAEDAVFVVYQWPAHPHFFRYDRDRASSYLTVRNLREFLRYLATETDASRIHVVGSSSGGPVAMNALQQLRLMHAGSDAETTRAATRIGQVVLAASDQESDHFFSMVGDGAADAAERVTLYATSTDLGLIWARFFGTGGQSIGRAPAAMGASDEAMLRDRMPANVDLIDATRALPRAGRGGLWAHGYWDLNPWVNNDVMRVLEGAPDPASRGLERGPASLFWTFPRDYPAQYAQ